MLNDEIDPDFVKKVHMTMVSKTLLLSLRIIALAILQLCLFIFSLTQQVWANDKQFTYWERNRTFWSFAGMAMIALCFFNLYCSVDYLKYYFYYNTNVLSGQGVSPKCEVAGSDLLLAYTFFYTMIPGFYALFRWVGTFVIKIGYGLVWMGIPESSLRLRKWWHGVPT